MTSGMHVSLTLVLQNSSRTPKIKMKTTQLELFSGLLLKCWMENLQLRKLIVCHPSSNDLFCYLQYYSGYSFGIVLWEIFHRQIPYKGRDPVSVAIDVVKGTLRPPMSSDVPFDMQGKLNDIWWIKTI